VYGFGVNSSALLAEHTDVLATPSRGAGEMGAEHEGIRSGRSFEEIGPGLLCVMRRGGAN
jgi:hypothetical protein